MALTQQQTDSRRRTAPPERRQQTPERGRLESGPDAHSASQALRALLAGAPPERLGAQRAAELNRSIGNLALLELMERRGRRPRDGPALHLPEAPPDTVPAQWSGPLPEHAWMGIPAYAPAEAPESAPGPAAEGGGAGNG